MLRSGAGTNSKRVVIVISQTTSVNTALREHQKNFKSPVKYTRATCHRFSCQYYVTQHVFIMVYRKHTLLHFASERTCPFSQLNTTTQLLHMDKEIIDGRRVSAYQCTYPGPCLHLSIKKNHRSLCKYIGLMHLEKDTVRRKINCFVHEYIQTS